MSLASSSYSYPILGAFWTIFMIFLWVIWFWILITIFIDLFRSHDPAGPRPCDSPSSCSSR